MKIMFKFLVLSLLWPLVACSVEANGTLPVPPTNESYGSKPAAIKDQKLRGSVGNLVWNSSRAVGIIQPNGTLMVSISGNDEIINCNYTSPLKPGLLFSIPMKVAEYDFDIQAPNLGHSITWVYQTTEGYQNIISDMVHISVTSVSYDRLNGGLSAKFLDPSNKGLLNGKFEVTICR